MGQITVLLFIRHLDEMGQLGEEKAITPRRPTARRIFPASASPDGRLYASLRWFRTGRSRENCNAGRLLLPVRSLR